MSVQTHIGCSGLELQRLFLLPPALQRSVCELERDVKALRNDSKPIVFYDHSATNGTISEHLKTRMWQKAQDVLLRLHLLERYQSCIARFQDLFEQVKQSVAFLVETIQCPNDMADDIKNDIENVFRYYMNMQLQHEKVNPLTVDPHSISIAVADCSMANGFVHGVQFVVSPFKNDLPFYCPAGGCDMFRLFYVVTPYQPSEMLECSGTWIDPGQKEQRVAAWRKNAVEKDDTEGLLSKLGEHVDPQIRILLSIYGLDEDFVFAPYRAAFAQKWLENVKAPVVL